MYFRSKRSVLYHEYSLVEETNDCVTIFYILDWKLLRVKILLSVPSSYPSVASTRHAIIWYCRSTSIHYFRDISCTDILPPSINIKEPRYTVHLRSVSISNVRSIKNSLKRENTWASNIASNKREREKVASSERHAYYRLRKKKARKRRKLRVGAIKLTKKYVHACARKGGKEGRRAKKRARRKNTLLACVRASRGTRRGEARRGEAFSRERGRSRAWRWRDATHRQGGTLRYIAACCHLHESARFIARGWPFARNKMRPESRALRRASATLHPRQQIIPRTIKYSLWV